ncbi:hypothetical protein GCM10009841_25530 [Microlunatus panaciterrae]|uniref:Alpha/beta-hydrolase family hydrolase n=1 Tax=Microlunatus panaciterrae TaxID=400768 RepID=A0ABS2REK5_9ACTN|nr:alpha/beta family hydrolase [Microlunatus panaciterrae]MBM7797435.1 putative alpha/beta-hydrolase family hydrolase [Microlunatus panaciterrae]
MAARSTVERVPTPVGDGRLFLDEAADSGPVLMLGHGAGGGVGAFDLAELAARLPERGVTVVRFEQPWRTAGRKVAVPPPRLDQAWTAAARQLLDRLGPVSRLFFGGRSAGARVACRTAPQFDVTGVVCLSFPLHPPGRPERSRAPELLGAGVPRLVIQGERDTFGGPDEVRLAAQGENIRIIAVPGAGHGLGVAKSAPFSASQVKQLIVDAVADFCLAPAP